MVNFTVDFTLAFKKCEALTTLDLKRTVYAKYARNYKKRSFANIIIEISYTAPIVLIFSCSRKKVAVVETTD